MSRQNKPHIFSSQAGFGHVIGMALVVLAFTAIGFIGYKLYAHPRDDAGSSNSGSGHSGRMVELDASSAPQIKKASDLDSAEAVLNQVDTASASSTDSAQLNSQLNSF